MYLCEYNEKNKVTFYHAHAERKTLTIRRINFLLDVAQSGVFENDKIFWLEKTTIVFALNSSVTVEQL